MSHIMQKPCKSSSYYYCFMTLLQNCIDSRAFTHGRLVHSHLITNGLASNLHLTTKLLIFYSKLGRTLDAHKVFDRMPERNIVSWTAMISGFSQNGCYGKALEVFVEMHREGFRANQFGYGSALRACTGLSCLNSGVQIQGCVQKSRFAENLYVQSALIDLHSKCGNMVDACHVFERMSERDLVSWNSIIGGFGVQGYYDDSFRVFCSLIREGKEKPDCFTMGCLLRGLSSGNCFTEVSLVHGLFVKLGFESNNNLNGSLINAYAKCGCIENSRQIYERMSEKDVISGTALLLGYAQNGNNSRDSLSLFREMTRANMVIDKFALCAMLNICANIPSLSFGRQIHGLTFRRQTRYDVAMGNALVDMYAKTGEIEEADRAFHEMEERNIVSWTSLIAGYGRHGLGHKAIELFKKMECEGLEPNDVTFLSVLFACSHNGLTDQGQECFSDMVKKYNIVPREEHLSCLVDIFARGGLLEEAYRLIRAMNVEPSASLWGTILGACCVHGNTSLGEIAARNLFRVDPDNPVNYVVLGRIYSAAGSWESAGKIMRLLRKKSLRKEPGLSLLQSIPKQNALLLPS